MCLGRFYVNTSICRFAYSATVKLKRLDSATLLVYHKDCDEEQELSSSEASSEEKQAIILGVVSSIGVLILIATSLTLFCLKRRGIICSNKNQKKEEIIVHQNELYGNLSNQDYFAERYDTNIVDRNQYYEEEYEA